MKAITVQQPWAWAIAYGGKRVENRTWSTTYRGPLAIHAGKRIDRGVEDLVAGLAGVDTLPGKVNILGAIVATATLVAVHRSGREPNCSPWAAHGQYHFVLDHVRPLATPIACNGALGFWDVPAGVLEQVEAATS